MAMQQQEANGITFGIAVEICDGERSARIASPMQRWASLL